MVTLFFTVLLAGLGFGLVLPSFLFVAENLGAPPAVATTIIGTFAIGQVISTPVWGRLSDHFGRKPILIVSLAGQAASYLLLAFADDLWTMAVARTLNGLSSGNLSVAMAYVTDVTPSGKRAQGMGIVGGAISLGFIIGPALGGILGGADAEAATLFMPGVVAATVCALNCISTLIFLRESLPAARRDQADRDARENAFRMAGRVLRRPELALMIVAGFLMYFAMALFETIFPLWSGARFGWGPREVGLVFTYLGALIGVIQAVIIGRLTSRYGEVPVLSFGLVCYAIGLVIMTQSPTWMIMMIGISSLAGGGALFVTTMSSLVSKQAGEQERGLVMGVYQSGSWMGRSVGPPFAGLLFGTVGVNAPLLTAAFCILPALVIVAVIRARTSATVGQEPD